MSYSDDDSHNFPVHSPSIYTADNAARLALIAIASSAGAGFFYDNYIRTPVKRPDRTKPNPRHPAPPLVGIELNPGPRSSKPMNKMKQAIAKSVANSLSSKAVSRVPKRRVNTQVRRQRPSRAPSISAFAATGSVPQQNQFIVGGTPDRLVDYDTTGAIRIAGSSLLLPSIAINITNQAGYSSGNPFVKISPAALFGASDRLCSYESIYEKYAFRRLNFEYIPGCPTTTTGSVFFGYSRDADTTTAFSLNLGTILDLNPSVGSPLWAPVNLDIKSMSSVKLYDTSTSGNSNPMELYQGLLYCITSITNSAAVNIVGYLRASYVIDFYGPSPARTSVSRLIAQYRLASPEIQASFRSSFLKEISEEKEDIEDRSSIGSSPLSSSKVESKTPLSTLMKRS